MKLVLQGTMMFTTACSNCLAICRVSCENGMRVLLCRCSVSFEMPRECCTMPHVSSRASRKRCTTFELHPTLSSVLWLPCRRNAISSRNCWALSIQATQGGWFRKEKQNTIREMHTLNCIRLKSMQICLLCCKLFLLWFIHPTIPHCEVWAQIHWSRQGAVDAPLALQHPSAAAFHEFFPSGPVT